MTAVFEMYQMKLAHMFCTYINVKNTFLVTNFGQIYVSVIQVRHFSGSKHKKNTGSLSFFLQSTGLPEY